VTHVAVVGGGITGLSAAYHLRHRAGDRSGPPPRVTLFEADERLGGKIRTSAFAGLPAVDEGADAFLARVPWALDLAHELGLDDLVSPATGRAYVWWDGSLHPIPEGLVLGVPAGLASLARSHLLSWPGKARAVLEPLVRRGHPAADNLGALIEHRFGSEVLDRLVDPLIGSINAGDTRELSLAASAPQVAAGLDRSRSLLLGLRKDRGAVPAGPVFLAPVQGMEALVVALRSAIDGVEVVMGQPVEVLERRAEGGWVVQGTEVDAVILAVPAYEAARLLAVVSPGSAALLGAISYASVAMVTLALPEAAVGRALDGSGHLVPKPAQRTLTAASWASTKWTHWRRPGQVVVRASVGRWGDEHAVDLDDGDLVEAVVVDLERHLGIDGGPTATRVTRWPRSFPQYAPGHLDRVADLERRLSVDAPGVVVAGAAYRGLGIPACIRQGREWAEATMQHLPR
jgi:oxygen-dependent protoporphyrinogen oxidase